MLKGRPFLFYVVSFGRMLEDRVVEWFVAGCSWIFFCSRNGNGAHDNPASFSALALMFDIGELVA